MRKKREYQSSELVKAFAKIHGFEEKLLAFEVKDFLHHYLKDALFSEVSSVDLHNKVLFIKIKSPLLKNDFRLRKSFLLAKFNQEFPDAHFTDLQIL